MKFTASSSALAAKLGALGKVINSKNALPILSDILFEVSANELRFTASDSEIWMQTGMELTECDGEGTFAIGAHDIIKAVKGLSEQPITFDVDMEKYLVTINYLNGKFSLPFEGATDFPKPVEIQGDVQKSIDKGVFNECISRAFFGCANNDLRPVMNGEYVDFTADYLAIVASDGHKLIRTMLTDIKSDTIGAVIMPKKVVGLLNGFFSRDAGDVLMHFDDRNAKLTFDATVITFRLIEGRYPNYNSVIPQNNTNCTTVDRQSLLAALKRVMNFSNSASYLVRFHFESGKIQLDAEDYDFSKTATETVSCEYDGTPMSIGFKSSTFAEILANITSKEVLVRLSDPSRAALVEPAEQKENSDVVMLIMPMLLND